MFVVCAGLVPEKPFYLIDGQDKIAGLRKERKTRVQRTIEDDISTRIMRSMTPKRKDRLEIRKHA